MQFTTGTFLQMLLGTSNVSASRQIRDDLLSCPATLEDSRPGVAETPLQIWNDSIVSGLSSKIVWILDVQLMIGPSWHKVSTAAWTE